MSQFIHEIHLFQHELLDAFVEGFSEACEAILGGSCSLEVMDVAFGRHIHYSYPMMFQLDYTGSSVGFLSVMAEESVFSALVGEDDWPQHGRGVVKEVLNTVSGGLLELLKRICPVVTLLSPKLIIGEFEYPQMSYLCKKVKSVAGDMCFVVAIDQRALDIEVLLRETTEMKEHLELTQNELVQSEKMASLGELVAGVAHEVNTPLGVGVTGVSHLSEMISQVSQKFGAGELKKSDFFHFLKSSEEEVELVYANLLRASRLIQNFKKVAVDQSSEKKRRFLIVSYLRDTVCSLSHLYSHRSIDVQVLGDEALMVYSYPGVFSQMVTHFVSNAMDHAFADRPSGHLLVSVEMNDGKLEVSFEDDGVGMTEEVQKKVFDPFFTTRRGQGATGLGLHIVYNAVAQSLGGGIRCFRREGGGARFVVSCPYEP